MASLILSTHGRVSRIVRLRDDATIVGRSPQCHLVLAHPAVSNFHAVLYLRAAIATLRDLQSTNGSFINGTRVSMAQLATGDVIRIADIDLQFVQKDLYDAEALPDPPELPLPGAAAETVPGALEPEPARRRRSGGGSSRIGGTGGAWWSGDAVAFAIVAQGREIQAFITADALQSHFGARVHGSDGAARAVAAYEQHNVAINVVAWARYVETEQEPIWVRSADFGASVGG